MNIETERLIIRSIQPGDEKAYAEMAGDGSLTEIGFDENFSDWAGDWIQEALELTYDKEEELYRFYSSKKADYKIVPLPKEEWKGTPILMRYTTEEYYDLEKQDDADSFSVKMIKKRFDTPVTHTPEEYDFPDKMYQDHWEKAEAFGIISEENGQNFKRDAPSSWRHNPVMSGRFLFTEVRDSN